MYNMSILRHWFSNERLVAEPPFLSYSAKVCSISDTQLIIMTIFSVLFSLTDVGSFTILDSRHWKVHRPVNHPKVYSFLG